MGRELSFSDLKDLYILRRVQREHAMEILSGCPVNRLDKGQLLLASGQSNQKLYIILSGSLSVHLDSPEREPVALLSSGETVGELSVIDDSPATAFVVAGEPSVILEVDEAAFWNLVSLSHAFAGNMLMLLAERIRSSDTAITRNIRLRRRFEKDAMLDALTGLKNRRWIDSRLPRIINRHERSELPLSLVMFDVDLFKQVNDRFGHEAGDSVLSTVAATTLACLRPTDICARYGGEEFLLVLTGLTDLQASGVAERVRKRMEGTAISTSDGRELPAVTVSLGIAQAEPGDTASKLIRKADTAMYRAKTSGRNRTCCHGNGNGDGGSASVPYDAT